MTLCDKRGFTPPPRKKENNMRDILDYLKNHLICWLIRHTHIHSYTIDEMIWKFSAEEIQSRVDMMKAARAASGCFFLKDYIRKVIDHGN